MSKKVHLTRRGELPVLEIAGDIAGRDAAEITEKLDGLAKGSATVIAIDLSQTTFIDSHGLGTFVYYWKTLGEQGKELVFASPSGFMRGVFEGTNLDQIFRVVESTDDL